MEDNLSRSDFLNEDGHGRLRDDEVVARQHWLNEEFRECVEEMAHAVTKLQAVCPEMFMPMTEASQINMEDTLRETVTETLRKEFESVMDRLRQQGYDDSLWQSRWQKMRKTQATRRNPPVNPATTGWPESGMHGEQL